MQAWSSAAMFDLPFHEAPLTVPLFIRADKEPSIAVFFSACLGPRDTRPVQQGDGGSDSGATLGVPLQVQGYVIPITILSRVGRNLHPWHVLGHREMHPAIPSAKIYDSWPQVSDVVQIFVQAHPSLQAGKQ